MELSAAFEPRRTFAKTDLKLPYGKIVDHQCYYPNRAVYVIPLNVARFYFYGVYGERNCRTPCYKNFFSFF